MDNIQKIDFEYLIELRELLQLAEESLLKIETQNSLEHDLKTLKRCFHSLKGNCGMLDLLKLETLFHELENYLNSNQSKIISELDLYLRVIDNLKLYLQEPNDGLLKLPFVQIAQKTKVNLKNNVQNNKNNLTVSVLDDNQEILNLFKDYLNQKNITVHPYLTMSSLRDDLLNKKIPDLIIIDFHLKEGINGNTVIRVLNNMLPKIPKVLMSANYDFDILQSAISRGIIGALKKPFSPTDLDDILLKTINIKKNNVKIEAIDELIEKQAKLTEAEIRQRIAKIGDLT
jgi:FixJ family two-component response regulator